MGLGTDDMTLIRVIIPEGKTVVLFLILASFMLLLALSFSSVMSLEKSGSIWMILLSMSYEVQRNNYRSKCECASALRFLPAFTLDCNEV